MKLKGRAWLRRFTILLVLLFGTANFTSLLIGFSFIFIGMLLHIWAIGCLVRNSQLTVWGPYRFIRHPFYLANLLIDMGICSVGANPIIFAAYIVLAYFIYYRRMKKEETHLTELFPNDYPVYIQKVPRFIPLIFKRYPSVGKRFSWAVLVSSGNEITRVLRLLIYPLVLYFLLRRFPNGIFSFLAKKSGYIRLPSDIVPGLIDYQEIIIVTVIVVFSIVSILFHRSKETE
ncbi:MAG: isoprenylcysteine carboxylmethyltransferase family protein [Planctomycetes bacterium]|nr:isoprenylcysteine carboxylmethyltransferase family protein [Planctomycetota bacterium]